MYKFLERFDFDSSENTEDSSYRCYGAKGGCVSDPFEPDKLGNSGIKPTSGGLIMSDKQFQTDKKCKDDGSKVRTIGVWSLKSSYRLRLNKNLYDRGDNLVNVKRNLYFETKINARQCFQNQKREGGEISIPPGFRDRINNIHEDPRLCCSVVMARDCINNLIFAFAITDDIIYALYGREKDDSPNASFYGLIPLINRGCEGCNREVLTSHVLGLKFRRIDKKTVVVSWVVDGTTRYVVNNPGIRVEQKYKVLECGGDAILCTPKILRFSFCHCSFLDFQLPNNYYRGHTYKEKCGRYSITRACSGLLQLMDECNYREIYPNLYGNYPPINNRKTFAVTDEERVFKHRIFGQGMETQVHYVHIRQFEEESALKGAVAPQSSNNFRILGDYSEDEDVTDATNDIPKIFPEKMREKEKKGKIIKQVLDRNEEKSSFGKKKFENNEKISYSPVTEELELFQESSTT